MILALRLRPLYVTPSAAERPDEGAEGVHYMRITTAAEYAAHVSNSECSPVPLWHFRAPGLHGRVGDEQGNNASPICRGNA